MSILQSVRIKQINFKENVWSGTKKTVLIIMSVHIELMSVKRGFTVRVSMLTENVHVSLSFWLGI